MGGQTDAIYRQWLLLRTIPWEPVNRTTAELHKSLAQEGLSVDRRTIQRDLERLATLFPLTTKTDGPALRWSWLPEGAGLEIPAMRPPTALTLQLAQDHLDGLFPPALQQLLQPYFDRAYSVLAESDLGHWRSKVRLTESGPRLATPEIDPAVRDAVYQALLEERPLTAGYYSRSRGQFARRHIQPLGLVGQEGVYYLIAYVDHQPEPRHLALHRMDQPELADDPADPRPDFDLDAYLSRSGAFDMPRADAHLALTLTVSEGVGFHLAERPLAADQRIEPLDGDGYWVTATVADTEALRWWLLGFGPRVRVEAPAHLRAEIADELQRGASQYAAGA